MLVIKKILFPADYSKFSESAIPHIARFLDTFDAELHILHVRDRSDKDSSPDKFKRLVQSVTKRIHGLSVRKDKTPVIRSKQMEARAAGPKIIQYAADQAIDLIILTTHGRRGISRFFLGSVAEEVARQAPCSVLTIKEGSGPLVYPEYPKILVPFDFSVYSRTALEYAVNFRQFFNSKIEMLHVLEDPKHSVLWVTGRKSLSDLVPDLENKLCNSMSELARTMGCPDAKIKLRYGHLPSEIEAEVREEHVGMIILPTHGLTGDRHTEMGSLAQMVLHYASCPVFTLRSLGKSLLADQNPEG